MHAIGRMLSAMLLALGHVIGHRLCYNRPQALWAMLQAMLSAMGNGPCHTITEVVFRHLLVVGQVVACIGRRSVLDVLAVLQALSHRPSAIGHCELIGAAERRRSNLKAWSEVRKKLQVIAKAGRQLEEPAESTIAFNGSKKLRCSRSTRLYRFVLDVRGRERGR